MESMVALRREDILESAKQVLNYFTNQRKVDIEEAILQTKGNIWYSQRQKEGKFFTKLKNIWCILTGKPIPVVYEYIHKVPDELSIKVLKYSDGWDWSEWNRLNHKSKTELTVEMIVNSSEPMNQVYYIPANIFAEIVKIQKKIYQKASENEGNKMSKTIFIVDRAWVAEYVTDVLCGEQYAFKCIQDPSDDILEALDNENVINGSDMEAWTSSWSDSGC
jgi:hypothetical protein